MARAACCRNRTGLTTVPVKVERSQAQTHRAGQRERFCFAQARDHFSDQAGAVCARLSQELGEVFVADDWRSRLGAGVVRSVSDGQILEKASVNYSDIAGDEFPASGLPDGTGLAGRPFQACGLSLIVHPRNPFVPATHLNVRLLVIDPRDKEPLWWFGGGFDLTPFFAFDEDCRSWHRHAAALCRRYGPEVYADFKRRCDAYFFLPHRDETRGVGGLFFDRLNQWGWPDCFGFVRELVSVWQEAWLEIAGRRRARPYTDRHRSFQLFRRGRYVEFNLLYDRGTLFGLQSGGRAEAILASLPPLCRWAYRLDDETGEFADLAGRLRPYLSARQWLCEEDTDPDQQTGQPA